MIVFVQIKWNCKALPRKRESIHPFTYIHINVWNDKMYERLSMEKNLLFSLHHRLLNFWLERKLNNSTGQQCSSSSTSFHANFFLSLSFSFRIIRMGIIRAICQRKEENLLMMKQKTSISSKFFFLSFSVFLLLSPYSFFYGSTNVFISPAIHRNSLASNNFASMTSHPSHSYYCQYEKKERKTFAR